MPARGLSTRLSRRSVLAGVVTAAASAAAPVRLGRKVRLAMWGLDGHPGDITKPLAGYPDVELVGVQDWNQAAARKTAGGKAPVFTDARKMLDEVKPDVVAINNNNGERAAAILECAHRKLHVMSEKPVGLTREDLDRVKQAVAASGIKLGMLLPLRLDAEFLALKKIVDSGEIGEVIQISSQKSYQLGTRPEWMKKRATYGSTILWIGIHMIDLMRWTSSREMKAVSSFMGIAGDLRAGEMENSTASSFRLDNGGTATLHMDYCRPGTAGSHGDDRVRLAGTKGVAEYMAATGVTVMSSTRKPEKLIRLPPGGAVFGEFLEHVYLGKPTGLPHAEIYRLCEITLGAHQAAISGKVIAL